MKNALVPLLRCPTSGQVLALGDDFTPDNTGNEVVSGELLTPDGKYSYPIVNGVARFVPQSNYSDNFGKQWNIFRKTQLDSHSGLPISKDRFYKATNWSEVELNGKYVLDIGCGSGRFAEIALNAGAIVVALDYSAAVDAAYENLRHYANFNVVQGDVFALPFSPQSFQYVYCLGVLQHTPDVKMAFDCLPSMVAPGGKLCVDYYWKRFRTMMNGKYLVRPITKNIPRDRLFAFLQVAIPKLLPISTALRKIPILGKPLQRMLPLANYKGVYPLTDQQQFEWSLLDTFDMLAPRYDNPQTAPTVKKWMLDHNFDNVEVLHAAHLVARGTKPKSV